MNIFDFLREEELEGAPDDPALAFTYLVNIAQRRLSEATAGLDPENQYQWVQLEDARHSFMNVIIGLAKAYEIEPFAAGELPRHDQFNMGAYNQFKSDLDHYMAQLVVGNLLRTKRDSVALPVAIKERIRTHLQHIKALIDNGDVPESKRAKLLAKLAEFEAALDKGRLSLLAVTRLVFEIITVSGSVLALADSPMLHKLLMNVMQSAAEAKVYDDENRQLPPHDPPPLLSPPRREERAREEFPIDDEIPF